MDFLPNNNTLNKLKQTASNFLQVFEDLQEPQYSTFWIAELPSLSNESNIEIPKVLSVDTVPLPSVGLKPYRIKGMSAQFADKRNAYTPLKIKVYNNVNNCGISYGDAWINLAGDKNGQFKYPVDYCKEFRLKLVDKNGLEVMNLVYMCWLSDASISQFNYEASKDTNMSYTLQVLDMQINVSSNIINRLKNTVAKLPSIFDNGTASVKNYFGDLTSANRLTSKENEFFQRINKK